MALSTIPTRYYRVLDTLDLTLFSASAIIVLDGLGPSAAIGAPAISWYIIILIVLFIPYALIIAELGTTYPNQGGLYIWIQLAFGDRWAARIAWYYWANVALGMPSVHILFSGILVQLFFPGLRTLPVLLISLGMTWITVLVSTFTMKIAKWVPNVGGAIKVIVILVLGLGGITYASRHGVANDLSFQAVLPSWNNGVVFLPVLVFNLLGFELMSGAGEEMKKPGHDIPIAILISGGLTAALYLMATSGILMAIPLEKISLIQSITGALQVILGDTFGGQSIVLVMGIGILFTFFSTMVTWVVGVNRVAARAAEDKWLPSLFGKCRPETHTPVGANVLMGLVSSTVLITYGLLSMSNDQLFWTLFAFGSIIFLLPYLILFPAFLKLRISQPDTHRPYRLPGGRAVAWAASLVCTLFILLAIVLFIWTPGMQVSWSSSGAILVGVIVTAITGEILVNGAIKQAS